MEITKYSEKWKIVRNIPYIPNDLYFSSKLIVMNKLMPKKYPIMPALIATYKKQVFIEQNNLSHIKSYMEIFRFKRNA